MASKKITKSKSAETFRRYVVLGETEAEIVRTDGYRKDRMRSSWATNGLKIMTAREIIILLREDPTLTDASMAEQLGCSIERVSAQRAAMGDLSDYVPSPDGKKVTRVCIRWTDELLDRTRTRIADGEDMAKIAAEFGILPSSLNSRIYKRDLQSRLNSAFLKIAERAFSLRDEGETYTAIIIKLKWVGSERSFVRMLKAWAHSNGRKLRLKASMQRQGKPRIPYKEANKMMRLLKEDRTITSRKLARRVGLPLSEVERVRKILHL